MPTILYLLVVLLAASFLVIRKGTTLLRGETVFGLTVVFFSAACISFLLSTARPQGFELLLWAGAVLISVAIRREWFLFRNDPVATAKIVEDSLSMLLIPYQRRKSGYSLQLREGLVFLEVVSILPQCTILRFQGKARQKKLLLLRSLLIKKFRPVFPRPTIDLR